MKSIIILYSLAISLAYIFFIGLISGAVIDVTSSWYLSLELPMFYPLNIAFSIGWGIAYILFAVMLALIISRHKSNAKAYFLIGAITILNIVWCIVFFQLHSIGWALLILTCQFALILFLINNQYMRFEVVVLCSIISIWYAFALTLNYSILLLN